MRLIGLAGILATMTITAPDSRITEYNPVVATTDFPAVFPVFDNDDIKVFVDGVERDDFAFSGTYVDGISTNAKAVFAVGVTGTVLVVGSRAPHRTNRFNPGAPIPPRDLNLAFDTLEGEMQEARRDIERALLAPIGSDGFELVGGDPGDFLIIGPDNTIIPSNPPSGAGNMNTATYDPQDIGGDAFDRTKHTGDIIAYAVAARSNLKALDTTKTTLAYLKEAGREGIFKWTLGNFSTQIAADTLEGLYIKADAVASTAGAWIRQGGWHVSGVRPEWYGAAANGTTDDTAAMRAALKTGYTVALSKADYKVTAALPILTTGQRIVGQGRGYGYGRPDYFARDYQAVSRIIGAGTFARRVLTRRKYRASGADPTDDAMSAIIEVHADGVSLEDFCVWLNCDYTNLSHTNLGDDIDIGVFRGGRPGFNTRNLAIIGHFRKTKLLHDYTRALNLPELLDPDGNALPKGASGQTFAGGDGWNHHNILMWGWGSGFTEYGPIHPGGNYYDAATGAITDERGASGDSDGRFTGRGAIYVTHQSGRRLVNPTGYGAALTRPNMEAEPDFSPAGIDIDGWASNSSSTVSGRGQVRNMVFNTVRVSSAAAFRIRIRDAEQIRFSEIEWIESGDYPSTASSWKDAAGVDININDYVNVTYGHIATHSTKTLGNIHADDVVGGIFQSWIASQTKFTGSQSDGSRLDLGVDSGAATIADDTVLTITPPFNGGWMRLSYSPVNAPIFNHSVLFYYDCGSSLAIQGVTGAVGANVTLATTNLTDGTGDGTDGNTNVSVQSGVIKIKNRTGSGGLWRWRWL